MITKIIQNCRIHNAIPAKMRSSYSSFIKSSLLFLLIKSLTLFFVSGNPNTPSIFFIVRAKFLSFFFGIKWLVACFFGRMVIGERLVSFLLGYASLLWWNAPCSSVSIAQTWYFEIEDKFRRIIRKKVAMDSWIFIVFKGFL